jgi:D-aminopeptidase
MNVTRLRDLGIAIGDLPTGPNNAITDVAGVRVGYSTLIEGHGPRERGVGPIRTGVTVVMPHDDVGTKPLFAGAHRLNGNGELTGLEWVRESGLLTSPIALTNTHSVGVVRDALVAYDVGTRGNDDTTFWSLPVVGETWDGTLNDCNGQHVRAEHLFEALESATDGVIAEGNVGGGTGMICHGFKGGTGTSSRIIEPVAPLLRGPGVTSGDVWTVGVLVQANYGWRERFRVDGVPVGREISHSVVPDVHEEVDAPPAGSGSIIIVVATDAPCLPHQCERLAQRAGLGMARVGGAGEHTSGDIFIAFATGNVGRIESYKTEEDMGIIDIRMISDMAMTRLYHGVIEATEEAITNALIAAETMTGADDNTAYALPHDRLLEVMAAYGRG